MNPSVRVVITVIGRQKNQQAFFLDIDSAKEWLYKETENLDRFDATIYEAVEKVSFRLVKP